MAKNIRDLHDIGDTHERMVPDSIHPCFAAFGLGYVGLSDAGEGYRMERRRPPTGHLLVCEGGRGEVWANGRWQACVPGQAYLSSAFTPMGFRTVRRRRWQIAWAYLFNDHGLAGAEPALFDADAEQFLHAVAGLYLEASGHQRAERIKLWTTLVRAYIDAVIGSVTINDPLWRLWATVDTSLAESWSLARLAGVAGLHPEMLRRLSLKHQGRSPMQHVLHLRMRRAEGLLRTTSGKLYTIARNVGYTNPFAFSTTFRRWSGRPPKAVR